MISLKLGTSICLLLLCCAANVVLGLTGCPPDFKEKCECGNVPLGPEKKMTYVTNCSNSGFDNVQMLQNLPPETEVLIFVGNEVRDLPLNIFSLNATNDNLHTIDLSNNKIQSIKGKTFHKVNGVKKLILNDNDIYIVLKDYHPRMFSNFINLEELHLRNAFTKKLKSEGYLSNLIGIFEDSELNKLKILDIGSNGISQLSYNTFCYLPLLEELYLGNNRLTDINVDFNCLTELKKLDLSDNDIAYLSPQTLRSLQNLSSLSLNLSNNLFKCDCHMLETYEWMVNTKVDLVNRETLRCSDHSAINKGKYLFSVPKEKFVCIDANNDDSSTRITHNIILAFGVIILIIVVVLLLHKNKQQVNSFINRFVQPIRNKFQYVSLERRDNTLDV